MGADWGSFRCLNVSLSSSCHNWSTMLILTMYEVTVFVFIFILLDGELTSFLDHIASDAQSL